MISARIPNIPNTPACTRGRALALTITVSIGWNLRNSLLGVDAGHRCTDSGHCRCRGSLRAYHERRQERWLLVVRDVQRGSCLAVECAGPHVAGDTNDLH